MDFLKEAKKYVKLGLSPVPLKKGMKRPAENSWQNYCTATPTLKELEAWGEKYPEANLGLALGNVVGSSGYQLMAIDIDDDELMDDVKRAVGAYPVTKTGKKGTTIIGVADTKLTNLKLKRMINGVPAPRPSVEILCHGSQTVMPPSIHPDTKKPYTWGGKTIFEVKSNNLPLISKAVIDEITAICHDKAEHFKNLNSMVWLGDGGGGNTHDTCVSAAANMVARGWDDHEILSRIDRAKKEACEAADDKYEWPQAAKTIQGWIDSAREKGMTDNAKRKKKIPPERVMANWLIEERGGFDNVACVQGILRSYSDGHWPKINLNNAMKNMYIVDEALTQREAKAAMGIAHVLTEDEKFGTTEGVLPQNDPKRKKICLANGTLNLMTGELDQHDKDHQLLHRLDFNWDEEALCPVYDKVIQQTFNEDQDAVDLWEEYCAHTLIPDTSFQKMLFLKGPGGNGKGTMARVLRGMHDPDAVGSVGITDLNDERKRTSLAGKTVNISGEQSRLNLVSDTYLKKITGEDPIDIRLLYGEVKNNVVLSVRFLELVNEMPATSDSSDALKRRMMILLCPNKIKNPDPDLDRKLIKERAGILRRWVTALHRLYDRGGFLEPESSKEEVNQYMLENDPVNYWITQRMDRDDEGTQSTELYADYKEWCAVVSVKPFPEVIWGRRMTSLELPSVVKRVHKTPVRIRKIKIKKGFDLSI